MTIQQFSSRHTAHRNARQANQARQRGGVILIVAFALFAIIGVAGLAIDSGRGFGVKAKLSAATDAAAIAGARALGTGASEAERIANAKAAADRFFNLNYPAATRGTTVTAPTTNVVREATGQWRVTVNARAQMPTTFMRVLGVDDTPVGTMGQTVRVSPDVMMVLDSSGSMESAMADLKQAARTGFVDRFIPGAGGDRMGLVTYSAGALVKEAIDKTAAGGFSRERMTTAINAMRKEGWTATVEGIRLATNELEAVPVANRSKIRAMLVFSDGAPNVFGTTLKDGGVDKEVNVAIGLTQWKANAINEQITPALTFDTLPRLSRGDYPLAGRRPFAGNNVNLCNVSRAARNVMENAASAARAKGIRVYTIGLGFQLEKVEEETKSCPGYDSSEFGTNLLRRLANEPAVDSFDPSQPKGLFCFARTTADLETCFNQIADDIVRLTL